MTSFHSLRRDFLRTCGIGMAADTTLASVDDKML
jgi:hypothetical protein